MTNRFLGINTGVAVPEGSQVKLGSYIGPSNLELDIFSSHLCNYQMGNVHVFASTGAMNGLNAELKVEGMLAYIQEGVPNGGNYYRLLPDLITWELLLQTGQQTSNIIRRTFQNEVQLLFNDIPAHPIVQVYLSGNIIPRPALYSDIDSMLYGTTEYNQSNVEQDIGWSWENQIPEYQVSFIPSQSQLEINFNTPRSGTAILTY